MSLPSVIRPPPEDTTCRGPSFQHDFFRRRARELSARLADNSFLGASLLATQNRRRRRSSGGRRSGPGCRGACTMRLRDAGSRIDNAANAIELCRLQRTRLGNNRESLHSGNNPVVIQRHSGSRRGSTCPRSHSPAPPAAVASATPTWIRSSRQRTAATSTRTLVRNSAHIGNNIARAIYSARFAATS